MSQIRPDCFDSFHGQSMVIDNLRIAVKSALRQCKPLGHILFTGPAGLGKTTLAVSVLPKEMRVDFTHVNCAAVEKAADLTAVLSSASEGSIVFLDEIHALPFSAREHLLTVMEDFKLNVALGDGDATSVIEVRLPPFTVVGATTRQGVLDGPMRSRFVNIFSLSPYNNEEMFEVLRWLAERRGCLIDDEAMGILIPPVHGVARKAVNLLEACIDTYFSTDPEDGAIVIQGSTVQKTLDRLGYVKEFSPEEVKYLFILTEVGRPIGLKAIAAHLDETTATVEDIYEPWLLRNGYVRREPKGRVLTRRGESIVWEMYNAAGESV